MIEVRQTDTFISWFRKLKDRQARVRIQVRIDYGPGCRVCFAQRGRKLIILLAGGDKRTQERDIKTALKLARNL